MDRYLDDELTQWMNVIGALLIVGPKWCGKTTTAEQYAKSVLKLQDIDRQEEYQVAGHQTFKIIGRRKTQID